MPAAFTEETLELIAASPAVQALVAAEDERVVERRRAALDELAAAKRRLAAAVAPLDEAVAGLEAHLAAAQRAVRDVETNLQAARMRRYKAAQPIEGEILGLEREIRATTPDAIDRFILDVETFAAAAGAAIRAKTRHGPQNMFTGRRPVTVESNTDGVRAVIEACRSAQRAAAALRREPMRADTLAARLADLRSSIPALDVSLTEVPA